MRIFNPANERLKRRYFHYLKNADGLADVTINQARLAITDYERFTDWRDFKTLRERDAICYREALLSGSSKRAAQLSSRATVNTKLTQVEKFFRWLSGQDGFRKAIVKDAFECFGLSRRDKRARASAEAQIHAVPRRGSARHPRDARIDDHRPAEQGVDGAPLVDRKPHFQPGIAEAQACAPQRPRDHPRCARGPREGREELPDLLLPCG